MCLKTDADIPHAREAATHAADRGIRLAHQCHTTSIFEQVDQILANLDAIGQPNFGLIYEPANLMLCGESYGAETLRQLAPNIMNIYIQNHRLDPDGPVSLPTYCRSEVRFHHLPIWENGGVDSAAVFEGLREIDWAGHFTIHQAEADYIHLSYSMRFVETPSPNRIRFNPDTFWFERENGIVALLENSGGTIPKEDFIKNYDKSKATAYRDIIQAVEEGHIKDEGGVLELVDLE